MLRLGVGTLGEDEDGNIAAQHEGSSASDQHQETNAKRPRSLCRFYFHIDHLFHMKDIFATHLMP
jgi:hypothetical protein